MVPQMPINVTLCVQYMSCYGLFYSIRLVLIARYFVSTRVHYIYCADFVIYITYVVMQSFTLNSGYYDNNVCPCVEEKMYAGLH